MDNGNTNQSAALTLLKVGDTVKTDFYPKDRHLNRTVIKVERYDGASQTGWKVTTRDSYGRLLSCDMAWYQRQVFAK